MAESLPAFPDHLRPLEAHENRPSDVEVYADVDDVLVEADRRGVLDVPAENARAARAGKSNLLREPAVADRLWRLGYLPRRLSGPIEAMDSRRQFLDAVRAFQKGAGLEVDGWVGERTWRALQELYTFETPTRVSFHARGGVPRPALIRAVRLRLWALGLLQRKPAPAPEHERVPTTALRRLWEMAQRLGMVEKDAPLPGVLTLIELAFDQDRLVRGIATSFQQQPAPPRRRRFRYLGKDGDDKRAVQSRVRSFIVCVTKIELWLLGFEVTLNGLGDFKVIGLPAGGVRNSELSSELVEFFRKLKGNIRLKRRLFTQEITPELLRELTHPRPRGMKAKRAAIQGDHSQAVSDKVKSAKKIEDAWKHGRSLVSRIWDGLRRIWRWIRRGVEKILEIGHNLGRAFYRYAWKAFEIVRFASRTVAAALSQYFGGRIRTGRDNAVRIQLSGDGDLHVSMPPDVADEMVSMALLKVQYFSKSFYFSTRILSVLLRTVKLALLGAFGSIRAWARLLWMLVRAYKRIRPLYRELRDLHTPANMEPLAS